MIRIPLVNFIRQAFASLTPSPALFDLPLTLQPRLSRKACKAKWDLPVTGKEVHFISFMVMFSSRMNSTMMPIYRQR